MKTNPTQTTKENRLLSCSRNVFILGRLSSQRTSPSVTKMAMFEEPHEVRNWKIERVLGSGGFGTVTLWKHKDGGQMIALKKCRCGADTLLTPKQKERWRNEVEIMQRLNHPNVVHALPLPEDLAALPSELPMLCMEYCAKGDLRQLLNRPENCCGLQEADVRRLIQNVNSAVRYLHAEKITHRDLKPENIVLSQSENGIVFKLIDLGYAKELEKSSICTSFVGTLQYLAPELFSNKQYSSSVDYWSLGLVSHEVITGVRPFLPNMAPVAWMKHVKRKAPEHICAYQTQDGRIEFSSHLFPQNHISSLLKREMERWLKLVLEWDPKKRGRDTSTENIIIFSEIEDILTKKIIRVFSMFTYERLSYEVDDSTLLSTLRGWIGVDTKSSSKDLDLMLASATQLDLNGTVSQCFNGRLQEALYVCKRGTLELPAVQPILTGLPTVAYMLQYPRERMEYMHQRRAYCHAVFFMQQENKLYRDFLVGCKLKLVSVVLRCQRVVRESQKVTDEMNAVSSHRDFCSESYKFDVLNAKEAKVQGVTPLWQQQMDSIDSKFSGYREKTLTLTQEAQKVTKLVRKLQNATYSNLKEDEQLNSQLEEGLQILDKLRRRPTAERSTLRDSLDMVKVIYNFLKRRDCVLHDQNFNTHLKELVDCEAELNRLMQELKHMLAQLERMKKDIQSVQKERQSSVWSIVHSLNEGNQVTVGSNHHLPHTLFSRTGQIITPVLSRSQSTRSLYSEENPPPVPPHGLVAPSLTASSQSLLRSLQSRSRSISNSYLGAAPPSQPVAFDVSDRQQPLCGPNYCNGNDSGTGSVWNSSAAAGSNFSFFRSCIDEDVSQSMINENRSLRALTQELMNENFIQVKKVLNEDKSLDWSFLKAETQ